MSKNYVIIIHFVLPLVMFYLSGEERCLQTGRVCDVVEIPQSCLANRTSRSPSWDIRDTVNPPRGLINQWCSLAIGCGIISIILHPGGLPIIWKDKTKPSIFSYDCGLENYWYRIMKIACLSFHKCLQSMKCMSYNSCMKEGVVIKSCLCGHFRLYKYLSCQSWRSSYPLVTPFHIFYQ